MPETPRPAFSGDVRRRVALRILPFLFLLYIISYLDRANVAFAKLPMSEDLGFSEAIFGFGAGIFFLGYLLLEIPGALIVEHWSARKWIARILVTWGLCSVLTGFINTPSQFYWVRFLLGLAEAGFFPGIVIYLSHWFIRSDRARAVSGFTVAVPLSLGLGAPVSALILQHGDWFGMSPWRWMFILEGMPAVLLGFVTWFYLTDWPEDAGWLAPDEKHWIAQQLLQEKEQKRAAGALTMKRVIREPNVLFLALALFFVVMGSYGFVLWLPTTIKNASNTSTVAATLWSALPFAASFCTMAFAGWSSDRSGERKWHVAVPMVLAGAFFLLSTLPDQGFFALMTWLCLTGACFSSWAPSFWALPTLLLGESAAAVSVGIINCVGNLGGFAGPWLVGRMLSQGYSQQTVVTMLAASFFMAGLIICCLKSKRLG
jgi:MFS transporter, ACS family, tartrate transporter